MMKRKLIVNSISGAIQILLGSLLVFITIPVFIKKLGMELFGVFSLLMLVGNLNSVFNLGIGSSLVKFISEKGKSRESDLFILTGLLILVFFSLIMTFLCIWFDHEILVNIFNVPSKYMDSHTITLFRYLVISNMILIIGQIPTSILDSLQMIYVSNILQFVYNFSYWALLLFAVIFVKTLDSLGIAILFSSTLWFLLSNFMALKYYGRFPLNINYKEMISTASTLLKFGSKVAAGGSIAFFYEPLTKIFITSYIGIIQVGWFDIALRLKNQMFTMIQKVIYPVFPLMSSLQDEPRIRVLIRDLEQKLSLLAFIVIPFIVSISNSFVLLWLKIPNRQIVDGIIAILSAFIVGAIAIPIYNYLIAKDLAGKTIIIQLSNVIVNATVFFLLYPLLGFYAVLVSNSSAIICSFLICMYYQRKYLKLKIYFDRTQLLKQMVIGFILLCVGILVNLLFAKALVILLLNIILFLFVSLMLIRVFKLFNNEDVYKYFGSGNIFSKIIKKTLVTTA